MRGDFGFGAGLLCAMACGASWLASGFVAPLPFAILGAFFLAAAFTLCWWFG